MRDTKPTNSTDPDGIDVAQQRRDLPQDHAGMVLVYSPVYRQLPPIVVFHQERTTFGREEGNDYRIQAAAVSRLHAVVQRRRDGYWLVDDDSRNGTFVNGRLVRSHQLQPHDVVRICDTTLRFVPRAIQGYAPYQIDGRGDTKHHPLRRTSSLIGGHQIDEVLDIIKKTAQTNLTVVIEGESGTGKELVARTVHEASCRHGKFIAMNCAAIPEHLIESELFGVVKGAYTGAVSRPGFVRDADGGTLFLDEIGDMPKEAQVKLLRVLSDRSVVPVGSSTRIGVDVRFVCATHRDLELEVEQERFRGDLWGRLKALRIRVPPLRERKEDLYLLILGFLRAAGRHDAHVSREFMNAVAQYDWPLNVRELENAVRVAVALAEGGDLEVHHLPLEVQRALRPLTEPTALDRPPARSEVPEGPMSRSLIVPQLGAPPSAPHARSLDPLEPASFADTTQPLPNPHLAEPAAARHGSPNAPSSTPLSARQSSSSNDARAFSEAPSEAEICDALIRHKGNVTRIAREYGKATNQVYRWLKRYNIDVDAYRG